MTSGRAGAWAPRIGAVACAPRRTSFGGVRLSIAAAEAPTVRWFARYRRADPGSILVAGSAATLSSAATLPGTAGRGVTAGGALDERAVRRGAAPLTPAGSSNPGPSKGGDSASRRGVLRPVPPARCRRRWRRRPELRERLAHAGVEQLLHGRHRVVSFHPRALVQTASMPSLRRLGRGSDIARHPGGEVIIGEPVPRSTVLPRMPIHGRRERWGKSPARGEDSRPWP